MCPPLRLGRSRLPYNLRLDFYRLWERKVGKEREMEQTKKSISVMIIDGVYEAFPVCQDLV